METLASVLLLSVVLAGAMGTFSYQQRVYIGQDRTTMLQQELRLGMSLVSDRLRTGGYGVPKSNLAAWMPWLPGFSSNPQAGTNAVTIAGCFEGVVATLSADVALGQTQLTATPVGAASLATLLNTYDKSLILIGDSENARLTLVQGSSISIDTRPAVSGNQGAQRPYPAGTPIRRVDIHAFRTYTDPYTGARWLGLDKGGGIEPVVEGVVSLTMTAYSARQFRVTLTAESAAVNPLTGAPFTQTLVSDITVKNN